MVNVFKRVNKKMILGHPIVSVFNLIPIFLKILIFFYFNKKKYQHQNKTEERYSPKNFVCTKEKGGINWGIFQVKQMLYTKAGGSKGSHPFKKCGSNMSFFQKPPPLTFGIFEALFSVGLISTLNTTHPSETVRWKVTTSQFSLLCGGWPEPS